MPLDLTGIGASPGIAIARAYVLDRARVPMPRPLVSHGLQIPAEAARFRWAVHMAREELSAIRAELASESDEESLGILDAHIELIGDTIVVDETLHRIEHRGMAAEWAYVEALQHFRDQLAGAEDEYLKHRATDLEFIEQRVLRHLGQHVQATVLDVPDDHIVIAHDLSPADTAQLDRSAIRGFVTAVGGRTSHTAIVARSRGIPAVVGVNDITDLVTTGTTIIIDGRRGEVVVDPGADDIARYQRQQARYRRAEVVALAHAGRPATTTSGATIAIRANIQSSDGVQLALHQGAEGIGLFRTEFLFMNRDQVPNEEEQYRIYCDAAREAAPYAVTIRSLDVGGDKLPAPFRHTDEDNRALGLRGIRFSLRHDELFRTQLRAILRASTAGKVRLVLPMVCCLEELTRTREILAELRAELLAAGHPVAPELPVGVMIEVPAAATLADVFADHADFLSVGTNDLIQYTLAIDRSNEQVAYLYQPLHPAVLRVIRSVVQAGSRHRTPVMVCGEMAGEPTCAPVLIGLGVRELSMNALAIPAIKETVRCWSLADAEPLAHGLCQLSSYQEVAARLRMVASHRPRADDPAPISQWPRMRGG